MIFIITKSNKKLIEKYVNKQNQPEMLTLKELEKYLAIIMILGLNNAPNYAYCWNRKNIYSYSPQISSMMHVKDLKRLTKY